MSKFATLLFALSAMALGTANAVPVDAGTITYGQTVSGVFSNTEEPAYVFSGNAGDTIKMTLEAIDSSEPFIDFYTGHLLPTNTLALFATRPAGTPLDPVVNPLEWTLVLGSTGDYTIAVYDNGNVGDNYGYDLTLTLVSSGNGPGPGNDVPEPGSLALIGLGLAGIGFVRRRKQSA